MTQCKFCNGNLEEIKRFNYWTVYLNDNQYYLGRLFLALNRHGPESTPELTKEEWDELKIILDKTTLAVNDLFNVDLFSYLTLQNKDRNHFHVHLFPRYENEREFNEEIFKDENWGKAPVPSPPKEIKQETLQKIKQTIQEKI